MKKLLIGLALGAGTSLAIRKIAREGHRLHEHCREMMSNHREGTHADGTESPAAVEARGSYSPNPVTHAGGEVG